MSKAAALMKEINKMLGEGTVKMGSDKLFKVRFAEVGLLPIDIAFGGGIPSGRFVVVTGGFSTLKTYIGLCGIASVQRAGGTCAMIDTEGTYDPDWAEELGVDTSELILERPENGELAMDVAEVLVRAGVDLIVFDSVAATLPQQEQGKRLFKENIQPGRQAALMSAACRKLTAANNATGGKTAIFWINQLRENIGMTFGPTEKMPGGRALPYYASIILHLKPTGRITRDVKMFTGDKFAPTKERIGQSYKALVEKSKVNKPFREVHFDYSLLTSRFDIPKFLFAQGHELGFITKKGNTWSCGSVKAVGKEKFLAALVKDEDTFLALENKVRTAHGLSPRPGSPVRAKKKAAASKAASSKNKARGRTLAAAPAASRSTGQRRLG